MGAVFNLADLSHSPALLPGITYQPYPTFYQTSRCVLLAAVDDSNAVQLPVTIVTTCGVGRIWKDDGDGGRSRDGVRRTITDHVCCRQRWSKLTTSANQAGKEEMYLGVMTLVESTKSNTRSILDSSIDSAPYTIL